MVDVQQDAHYGWLQSDTTVFISALAAITVATSSVLLWRCQRTIPLQDTAHAADPSTLRMTLTLHRLSAFFNPVRDGGHTEAISEEVPRDATHRSEPNTQGKTSRSKERRRRGKDPLKEFSKAGKKYKDLLRQLNRPSTMSNGDSSATTTEQDRPQQEMPSRRSSSAQVSNPSRINEITQSQICDVDTPPRSASSTSFGETANTFSADKSDPETNAVEEPEEKPLSPRTTKVALSDTSPASDEPNASSLLETSSQISKRHLPSSSAGSSSLTEASCLSSNTSSHKSQGRSHSRLTSCSWDWDGQSSGFHSPPPRFAGARAINPQHGSSSPLCSPTAFSPHDITPTLSGTMVSSPIESTRCDIVSPGVDPQHRPTPRFTLPSSPIPVAAQTQIASLRGALEAARLREEKSRAEAERRTKDYDALSWRWTEERARWHRREAELYAHIRHLTLALQMYAGLPPFQPATVPLLPAFVSSPLPSAGPSTMTYHLYSPPLNGTRGRQLKRAQGDGEGNGDSNSDMFSLNDKVAGAILKRPENLRAETQRSLTPPNETGPLRFPSLSDLGNVWHRETEAEAPRKDSQCGTTAGFREDGGGRETKGTVMEDNSTALVETDARDTTPHDEGLG